MTASGPGSVSYDRLYRLWEDGSWSATAIDLSRDQAQWKAALDERQRESAVWNLSMALVAAGAMARALTSVLDSSRDQPEAGFLVTQIADAARQRVFFDRWLREVAGQGKDTATTLRAAEQMPTWGFRQIFSELERVTDALRKKPRERPLLAQAIALHHVVVEGLLGIPDHSFIQRYLQREQVLPSLSATFTNIARDQYRHISFGIEFLSRLIASSKDCRHAAVEMWNRTLPWSVGVFLPPQHDHGYVECFDFTLDEIYASGLRSFETKLARIGINPNEIQLLARSDTGLSYEERAHHVSILIDSHVFGDERREPELSWEAFEILFAGMVRAVDVEVARSLGGAIQWDFTDAEPWHLVVTNNHVEAKLGRVDDAALGLECASGDWARIAVGRTDARWALLRRRLRLHGSISARAKLPKLFR